MASGRRVPRGIRKSPDAQALAQALRSPGIDPRAWVVYGVVGSLGDQGELAPDLGVVNPATGATLYDSVFVDARGVLVDVVAYLPSGEVWPLTARYNGISGGPGLSILSPIRPGDEVVVLLPSGRMENAVVVTRLNNEAHPIAGDAASSTEPTWQNDRLVIHATEPLQIKAPAVTIDSPLVKIAGRVVRNVPEPL